MPRIGMVRLRPNCVTDTNWASRVGCALAHRIAGEGVVCRGTPYRRFASLKKLSVGPYRLAFFPQILEQRLHLSDFLLLIGYDPVGEGADARVGDAGPFAGEHGDRMVRDHRLHPRHIVHSPLAADQPQRQTENEGRADEDPHVDAAIRVVLQREREHDRGHGRAHDQRHPEPRLAEEDVVELKRVQVHQAEHDHRGRGDHGGQASVGVHDVFPTGCIRCVSPDAITPVRQ